MSPLFLLLIVGVPMFSQLVASQMQSRFVRYSQDPVSYSGAEIAAMMLEDHGIQNVRILSTRGELTDHYDPAKMTVNLSESVYAHRNVAAAAVAAHECGHAVQHATNYPLLTARSKLVPLLSLSNKIVPIMALSGAGFSASQGMSIIGYVFIAALGLPTLFALVTLPVEFNASNRALRWMDKNRLLADIQHERAKNALFWAAMTYVIAALGSLAQLLYYASFLMRRRR